MPISKINPFYSLTNQALYSTQINAHFVFRGVTSQNNKFTLTVYVLPYTLATEVRDITISSPADNRLTKLKEELIVRTYISPRRKLLKLLN